MDLRPYQARLKYDVEQLWALGKLIVLMVLATGGGKTAILAKIIQEEPGASCVIAHRHEIVAQLSLALARYGVRHNIIASARTRKLIAELHVRKLGKCFYDPRARCVVASVDTLIKRKDLKAWAAQVRLWVTDEGHHLVEDNKWHTAISMFPDDARGLLPTATPDRADRKGLGTEELGGHGFAEAMAEGPPMRWLIDQGYLTDYRMVLADSHMEELLGAVGPSGDHSNAKLTLAADRSTIVGDVVETYRTHAWGLTGLVFSPDVGTATKMTNAYRSNGVRVELVTGDTDPDVRARVFDTLEQRTLDLAVAVDIVSEGTDIPALQVGIFGRLTASLQVYMQQFGRILRPIYAPGFDLSTQAGRLASIAASIKPYALVIDHVGNYLRHGPPDRVRVWQLADSGKVRDFGTDAIPQRACLNIQCLQPYERHLDECPHCKTKAPAPAERSSPAMVAGDMIMLDAETMRALREKVADAAMSLDDYRARLTATKLNPMFVMANAKKHHAKLEVLEVLRRYMGWWCGAVEARGLSVREQQKLFFIRFGVDVFTAQTLDTAGTEALAERVRVDRPPIGA